MGGGKVGEALPLYNLTFLSVDPVTLDVKLIDLGSAVFVEEDELVPFDGKSICFLELPSLVCSLF